MNGKFESDSIKEAYFDRNQAVMLAARLAEEMGWDVGYRDGDDPSWPVLYIELSTGQVSWHIPREEIIGTWHQYSHVWDGHDLEEKRKRIEAFIRYGVDEHES